MDADGKLSFSSGGAGAGGDGGGAPMMILVAGSLMTIACLYVVDRLRRRFRRYMRWVKRADALPGPKLDGSHPWLAHLHDLTVGYSETGILRSFYVMLKDVDEYRDQGICRRWEFNPYRLFFARAVVHVVDTDLIRQVLTVKENAMKLDKPRHVYDTAYPVLGDSILSHPDGALWKHQRKVTSRAFRQDFLEHSCRIVGRLLHERVFPSWVEKPNSIEMMELSLRLTVEVIGLTALGHSFQGLDDDTQSKDGSDSSLYSTYRKLCDILTDRIFSDPISPMFRLRQNRIARECTARLEGLLDDIITERMARKQPNDTKMSGGAAVDPTEQDILSYLLMEGDDGEAMEYKYVKGNCRALMFAGHDTTAVVLAQAIWYLAANIEAQGKLRREVDTLMGDRGRNNGGDTGSPPLPAYRDLMKLEYLDAVVRESLRLTAPAPVVRQLTGDITLMKKGCDDDDDDGVARRYTLPAGSMVFIAPSISQRSGTFVSYRPNDFVPERFLNDCGDGDGIPRLSRGDVDKHWIPFSTGPRNCVGMPLAMVELKTALAHVVRNFTLRRSAGADDPITVTALTFKPHEVLVDVRKRQENKM